MKAKTRKDYNQGQFRERNTLKSGCELAKTYGGIGFRIKGFQMEKERKGYKLN